MGKYEEFLCKYEHVPITETDNMPHFLSGLFMNGEIFINSDRPTTSKLEALAEELAHRELTHGNITDTTSYNNRKFENYARRLSYEMLIPINGIIKAFKKGVHNLYELANFFEVSEGFVQESITHYKQKYGHSTRCGKYVIQFEPLRVFEYKILD